MSQTPFWQEKIVIKNLVIPRFMAAPLDGITDSPLRQLIRQFSPDDLLMTEMRHVSCVANEKDEQSLKYNPTEQPLAFQFSANRHDFLDKAVEKVIERGFVMINLNAGCPAPVVTRSGSGSALMANLPLLQELIQHFVKTINGRIPFTLKIRAGFKQRNAVDVAKLAQDNGVDCIMIHPRTQPDGFTSRLDFDLAKRVKEAVKIPVIFSGNINRFEQAQRTYELTGADGFMIGRALWGAPWKLREITDAAEGKQFSVSTLEALESAMQHLDLNLKCFGPRGFIPFKKQIPQYIRSIINASEWRHQLLRTQTEADMRAMLESIILQNSEPQHEIAL
jgi:tRNA-dihydrouridine synthase B